MNARSYPSTREREHDLRHTRSHTRMRADDAGAAQMTDARNEMRATDRRESEPIMVPFQYCQIRNQVSADETDELGVPFCSLGFETENRGKTSKKGLAALTL